MRAGSSLPVPRVVARVGPAGGCADLFRLAQDCGVARGERAPVAIRNGEPVVAGTELPVAEIVRAAHARIVHMGPAEPAVPGIGRASLEPILAYCAERRCKGEAATCPGCRLRTEQLGLKTLDDFIAWHAKIEFTDSALCVRGGGTQAMTADSLEVL